MAELLLLHGRFLFSLFAVMKSERYHKGWERDRDREMGRHFPVFVLNFFSDDKRIITRQDRIVMSMHACSNCTMMKDTYPPQVRYLVVA